MDAQPKHTPAYVARRRRIVTITGVASATNARAAHHDTAGTYFLRDPNSRHREVEARVLDLVRRCEQYALATWGHAFRLHVRLDDRRCRKRSRGGLYHSRWRTERLDARADHDRRGGINIALARRVRLDDPEPFRPGTFHEYTHLSPWGDVGTTSMFAPLDVCVAHEVAHAFAWEARGLLCDRLGLHPADADEPHGRLFAEVYARLRRHIGLIDPARPEWLPLDAEARVRALAHTRKALRPEVAVLAVTDPAAYRRQQRAARQRQRREAQRHEQADGTVPPVMNTGMEV